MDLAKEVFQQMLQRGTIVNRTEETVIRLLPPFIIKKQHIDTAVRQFDQVLENLVGAYVIVGLLVGFLVIAMYLPIFKMGSVL